jgi:hypothetical protein
MGRRVNFTVRCPKGHESEVAYELQDLLTNLTSFGFFVRCTVCGDSSPLGEEQRQNLANYIELVASPEREESSEGPTPEASLKPSD